MGSRINSLKDEFAKKLNYRTTYLTLAEDSYYFIKDAMKCNLFSSHIAHDSALIVINYFKYIIDTYDTDENEDVTELRTSALKSFNLAKHLHYMNKKMKIEIPTDVQLAAASLYPYYEALEEITQDSFLPTKNEIEFCYNSMETCRKFALLTIESLEKKYFCETIKATMDLVIHDDEEYKL